MRKIRGGVELGIYPFGDLGVLTKRILEEQFGIKPKLIFDDKISKFNPNVLPSSSMELLNHEENKNVTLIFVSAFLEVHDLLRENALKYVSESRLSDVWQDDLNRHGIWNERNWTKTICGKHSYGSLCNQSLVKSVGAFCSFGGGAMVVGNHPTDLLSTSPILTGSGGLENVEGFKYVPYEVW